MNLSEQIYTWLVQSKAIPNNGEIDEKGKVVVPPNQASNIESGYIVGQILKRLTASLGKKTPSALANVKSDGSKNTKLTNWNFIWLAFDVIGLKMDTRVKELILQGENALVIEVLRQLREQDPDKKQNSKISIKSKPTNRPKGKASQVVDIKKINLEKDPQQSQSSLEYLILILKTSLGMNLQQILGLFTNQNKYLAHIIVKGVNDNFQPVILFYTLLHKHINKLKSFHSQDSRDAEACLYAIKPGFISKNQKVAELTLELFGKISNVYHWFTGQQSKCVGTFLLGTKRHPILRQLYWHLLLQITEGSEVEFFTQYYPNSFQNATEQTEISTYLLKFTAESFLGEQLSSIGVISGWLQTATQLPEDDTEAQLIAFDFIGQLMLYLPKVIQQNEGSLQVLERNWDKRNLRQFSTLLNNLLSILQKLGQGKSSMAPKIYMIISQIAKDVGEGDKFDYLIQNFLSIIARFPSIPTQRIILTFKHSPLTQAQYLLVGSSIEVCQDIDEMLQIGTFLRHLFIENPLLNYYMLSQLKQVVLKVMNSQRGLVFISQILEDTLQHYTQIELKFKSKPKQQKSLYFGKSGIPDKLSKQAQEERQIKQRWKQIYVNLVIHLSDIAFAQEHSEFKELIKEKIIKANSSLKFSNHKVGSKALEDIMAKRFSITKEEQVQLSEEFRQNKEANQMQESSIKRSKVISHTTLSNKLRGPEGLAKEFQTIVDKRKQEEDEKRARQLKRQFIEQKKKLNVKKQLQITNLLRGQIGEAQIREQGYLQRLIQQTRDTGLVPLDQLQNRDLESIEIMLKKYHRVLRHLFLQYTGTMYSNHTAEAIEDNQRRKQILTAVQLGKMLKDYRLFHLTSQPQINSLIRDINVKLLNRRQVHQIDFIGFQQFIIQFCYLRMTIPHEIIINTPNGFVRVLKDLKDQSIHTLLKEFFFQLKQSFIARRQKVSVFDDIQDVPLTKEQLYEVNIFNQKINSNPHYILPKGYKKLVDKHVNFPHKISQKISGLSQKYEVAFDALDHIFQKSFNMHVMESIAEKTVTYKVKPISLGTPDDIPRGRASSTLISRKAPLLNDILKNRASSKGIAGGVRQSTQLANSQEVAGVADTKSNSKSKEKDTVKPKRAISLAKLAELQKGRQEARQKRVQDKQEKRQMQQRQKKELQRKRRVETQKFLEQQRAKYVQKQKKAQFQRIKKYNDQEQVLDQKKENKQKFKQFHQKNLEVIKKIASDATQKKEHKKYEEIEGKQKFQEQKKRLREKIEEQDKTIVDKKKDIERKLTNLYESQPIKQTFQRYEPNLKAIFNFLISQTHMSLTQKKHNNEIIYDTWRYFLNSFEMSPLIVHNKDVVLIYKNITKDKIVPKEYLVGLSYKEFQQSLLRVAVKYKSIFNLISERIKDKIEEKPAQEQQSTIADKNKKGVKSKPKEDKSRQSPTPPPKELNEFENAPEINIKELIKQNNQGKDDVDVYGDLSKVTDRTVRGLIYYLKVPNSKPGQEERFRAVLADKHTASVQNADRLKEKLNEDYTLEYSPKKPGQHKNNSKVDHLGFNPNMLQKT